MSKTAKSIDNKGIIKIQISGFCYKRISSEVFLYCHFYVEGGIPMAGRKPKPTVLKKLEGNPGKRKLNTKEPVPAKGMSDPQFSNEFPLNGN